MQPTTHNDIAATYGPLGLSALGIIVIALAAFSHGIDWTLAVQSIGAILAANGLLGAARWQAAPGLMADIQAIIQQLADHIQALHAQQVSTPTPITLPTPTPVAPEPASATEPTQTSV